MWRNVLGDHGTTADHCPFPDRHSGQNGAVGSKTGAPTDERLADFPVEAVRAWVTVVREGDRRTDEHVVLECDAAVDRDEVLNAASGAYADILVHEDRLTQPGPGTDYSPATDLGEVPDLHVGAQHSAILDDCRWMNHAVDHRMHSFLDTGEEALAAGRLGPGRRAAGPRLGSVIMAQPSGCSADDELTGPLLSVVIATYNRRELVQESIRSVLAQSFRDFEVVVIDDGSTDGTTEAIEQSFPEVRVVRQANAERSAAFNHGIRIARGRYVCFLADDDLFEPWHLAQFELAWRSAQNAPIFATLAQHWNPQTGRLRLVQDFDPLTLWRDVLVVGTVVSPVCLFVERGLLLQVGGFPEDRSLIGAEDWVLLLNLARRHPVRKLNRPSVRVRRHAGRSMNNLRAISDSKEAATRRILEDDLLGEPLDPESRRLLVAGTHRLVAAHRYGAGDMAEAREHAREVIRLLGWREGVRLTGQVWVQTWLGSTGSTIARRCKERLTWRRPGKTVAIHQR